MPILNKSHTSLFTLNTLLSFSHTRFFLIKVLHTDPIMVGSSRILSGLMSINLANFSGITRPSIIYV